MYKKYMTLLLIFVLSGCSDMPFNQPKVVIDWVDFVKWKGTNYMSDWTTVVTSADIIGEEVGEIAFKVADVVHDSDYRTKDGDAAFLDIGTKLFRVEGYSENEMLAAQDPNALGGYKLYKAEGIQGQDPLDFNALSKENIQKVELYLGQEKKPYKVLKGKELKTFLKLLEEGTDSPGYSPNTRNGYPTYYQMVFDTGEAFGYNQSLDDDGLNVFYYPNELRLVDSGIRDLLQ